MRRAARVDANQTEVVARFRSWGASVRHTHMVGEDFPDLVIGLCNVTHLVEVKDGSKPPSERRPSEGQVDFARSWKGATVLYVETLDDVDEVCRLIRQRHAGTYVEAIRPRSYGGTT